MRNLGKTLKYLRNRRGLTQEETGRVFNVVKQTVSNWESDIAKPDLATFETGSCLIKFVLCRRRNKKRWKCCWGYVNLK